MLYFTINSELPAATRNPELRCGRLQAVSNAALNTTNYIWGSKDPGEETNKEFELSEMILGTTKKISQILELRVW